MKKTRNVAREGLLFYLSGENGPVADFAMGEREPYAYAGVSLIPDGVGGMAFSADPKPLFVYKAPGNIYAERGTVSFFFRAGARLTATPFPILNLTFSDGSTRDRTFLRIDYNGENHGIEAVLSDIDRNRVRVPATLHGPEAADTWMHIALSWDENQGVKLYLDGKLCGEAEADPVFYAGLGLIGFFTLTPGAPQDERTSRYSHGGDIDEFRIYDRMLSDENIRSLFMNEEPSPIPESVRTVYDPVIRKEWNRRYGWDRRQNQPMLYPGDITVRKVAVREVLENGRTMPFMADGIRETGWPEMPAVSTTPGRKDYFKSFETGAEDAGKSVTLKLANEPWNHLEIQGNAGGALFLTDGKEEIPLDERQRGHRHSIHEFKGFLKGKDIRFENAVREEVLSDFSVYSVKEGNPPKKSERIDNFYVDANTIEPEKLSDAALYVARFVNWRYFADERNVCIGLKKPVRYTSVPAGLPVANILVPYANKANGGLSGIEMTIPAMKLKDTVNSCYNVNIRIQDPLWQLRSLVDFSLRMRVGEPKKIYFDIRDRILPENRILYMTIAVSAADFRSDLLQNMPVRLHFKAMKDALPEHIEDRLADARACMRLILDNPVINPRSPEFRRLLLETTDVLRYAPQEEEAKKLLETALLLAAKNPPVKPLTVLSEYENEKTVYRVPVESPTVKEPKIPEWAEAWAFWQTECMKRLSGFPLDRIKSAEAFPEPKAPKKSGKKQDFDFNALAEAFRQCFRKTEWVKDFLTPENIGTFDPILGAGSLIKARTGGLPAPGNAKEQSLFNCNSNGEERSLFTWNFPNAEDACSLGILVLQGTREAFTAVVFNMASKTVRASMEGVDIEPGTWRITTGSDTDQDLQIDDRERKQEIYFENLREIPFEFPGKTRTLIHGKRITRAVPYAERPDLSISAEDLVIEGKNVTVTVWNAGMIATPEAEIALIAPDGSEVRRETVPPMEAPEDGWRDRREITLKAKSPLRGHRILLDPDEKLFEITRKNNIIEL